MSASKRTTDHATIRRWVAERNGRPAHVKGTGDGDDMGLLRIHFPDDEDDAELEEISWDDFFEKFDEKPLAFLYQERKADGALSTFHKFLGR